MAEGCHLIGEDDFCCVDLGPFKRAKAVAFLNRQFGVEFQEPAHVGVRRVAPELPEFVGRAHFGVQPDRAIGGFAHFLAVAGGQEGRGQAVNLVIQNAAGQVDPVDDIAPLIAAAHLQQTAIAAVQFEEVVGL